MVTEAIVLVCQAQSGVFMSERLFLILIGAQSCFGLNLVARRWPPFQKICH